jgi:hypothetical protein
VLALRPCSTLLPPLEILERAPERPFYRCFVSREFSELATVACAETEEDKINVGGLLGAAFTPSRASAFEEAALDAIGAAEASGIDSNAFGDLMLHRTLWFECRDEFRLGAPERVALLVEEDDSEAVLEGIAARDRAAGLGARPGAVQRIPAIGFNLQKADHFRYSAAAGSESAGAMCVWALSASS